jgi:hypothetical protein
MEEVDLFNDYYVLVPLISMLPYKVGIYAHLKSRKQRYRRFKHLPKVTEKVVAAKPSSPGVL